MAKPVVELKDVSIFQRKNLILHDINLTIERGEFVYLIGKTGSGKSSLLKILYGDLPLKELYSRTLSCFRIELYLAIWSLSYELQAGKMLTR